MEKLYTTTDFMEAELICLYLKENGVEARILNRNSSITLTPDSAVPLEVHVPKKHKNQADELIQKFLDDRT